MRRLAFYFMLSIAALTVRAEQFFKPIQQNAGAVANGLQASLNFVKNEFGPGESIVAAWKITNVSDKSVAFSVNRNTWYDVQISIRRDGKLLQLSRQMDRKDMKYNSTKFTLDAGDAQTFVVDVCAVDWSDAAWHRTYGLYEVQLTLGGVQTPWARFRVTAPGERRPELSPDQLEQLRTLIGKLDEADFTARDEAFREIKRMGKGALTLLEETVAREGETAIAAQCRRLIQEITQPVAIAPPPVWRPRPAPPIIVAPTPRPQPQPPLPPPDLEF